MAPSIYWAPDPSVGVLAHLALSSQSYQFMLAREAEEITASIIAQAEYIQATEKALLAQAMAELHWDLRKGTKVLTPEWTASPRRTASPGSSNRSLTSGFQAHDTPRPSRPEQGGQWTSSVPVASAGDRSSQQLHSNKRASSEQPAPLAWDGNNTQVLDPKKTLGPICTECRFFKCPNATGSYDECPFKKVYEVPDRYDPTIRASGSSGGDGVEPFPRRTIDGSNIENSQCRLYTLGLKSLTPDGEVPVQSV
ncbi:hypothetical protein B0H15DRAFT_157557 [Mycena belliarum]|uniref:Uncharacterized protein n=1 Tax=Mycena belliarum TaxID=1033014 RepID=A0AAD6U816_9AGAR|nr:hypothetical protein B0H15DRAFT_157557 [Mycena belliae]